jgi:AICAR transformylase/IMP cyclohydrolase PurH (only IMP cyclohydrolase domain in Aful)
VIAANGPVTAALARQIKDVFTEVVIAPEFDAEALDILSASKNVRLLRCAPPRPGAAIELRLVTGGMLCSPPTGWTSRAMTRRTGSSRPVSRSARSARGPGVRVEGMPFGQIQRHLAGLPAAPRSGSGWARSTG